MILYLLLFLASAWTRCYAQTAEGHFTWEALMYAVVRRFNHMRSIDEAARRAAEGLGAMLQRAKGSSPITLFASERKLVAP